MDLHALTSAAPEDSELQPEPVIVIPSNAETPPADDQSPQVIPVVMAEPSSQLRTLAVIPSSPPLAHDAVFWDVHSLVRYYLVLTMLAAWLLLNVWGGNMTILQRLGVTAEALQDPLLKTARYTVVGSIFGSIHYQMRVLFKFYLQDKCYDRRWIGKYTSAPWESALMALAVFGLVRGGIGLLGGTGESTGSPTGNFAALGIGALVGFGMREVVRWVHNLVQTMFGIKEPSQPPETGPALLPGSQVSPH